MRILPVTFQINHKIDSKNNYEYNYSLNKPLIQNFDLITFRGNAQPMTAKAFKKLSGYMTDLYTGDKMLSGQMLTKMKKRGFFQGPISEVVRKLTPYKSKYLEPVELKVFEQIEKSALETPDIDLTQLFKNLYNETRSQFRKIQKPIFDEIKTLGAQLPEEHIQEFFKFMERTDRKLYDEPIRQKFSYKEFSYKVTNILEKTSDENLKNRIQKLMTLLGNESLYDDSKTLTPEFIKKVLDFKKMKVNGKKSDYYKKHLKSYKFNKNSIKIKIIENIKNSVSPKDYRKFETLCQDNIDMLFGKPVKIPFSNKTFIYDLEQILSNVDDSVIKQRILTAARKLPTSSESPEALILKFRNSDPNIIGDRLFNPSLVSIEHMKPESLGGETTMHNCALAKRKLNSIRGNQPLWEFLQQFDVKNQIKYAKNLVKLNHRGRVRYDDSLKHLETLEREGHLDLTLYKSMLMEVESPVEAIKKKFAKKH